MVATFCPSPARPSLRPHAGPAASRPYERRRPEKTPLYKIVSECLESWLADRSAREHPVAAYVEEEFRGDLRRAIAVTRIPDADLAAAIGVESARLAAFREGDDDLSADAIERLVAALNLRLMHEIPWPVAG